MDLTKLKEQAKQYALMNKKWRKSIQTVLTWAEKDLIWDDIREYEQRTELAKK